jgi:hypothetical protein
VGLDEPIAISDLRSAFAKASAPTMVSKDIGKSMNRRTKVQLRPRDYKCYARQAARTTQYVLNPSLPRAAIMGIAIAPERAGYG